MPRGFSGSSSSTSKRLPAADKPTLLTPSKPTTTRSRSSSSSVAPPPLPAQPGWAISATPNLSSSNNSTAVTDYALSMDTRKIDIAASSSASAVDAGSATVLTAFPLLDTITLLIIFLQLPSTLLTVIHFLYALQTFVPPSTTLLSASTAASLPSLTNLLLQGSNGSPSLLTIIIADIVVALLSMLIWPPARAFLIDFAQAVIAISFGAGNGDGVSGKNVVVCAGLMGGIRVVQGRWGWSDAWDSLQPANRGDAAEAYMFLGRAEPSGWIRSMVAIHIVAQWGMQLLRRWLKKRPEAGEAVGGKDGKDVGVKVKDPEAAVAPGLERGDSVSGKRRKKKEAQSIRNNQPLWATVANMIVHLAKEIERSRTSSEAQNTHSDSAAVMQSDAAGGDQVWIARIGSNEIAFVAGLVGGKQEGGQNGTTAQNGDAASGGKEAAPFFVRVNGIVWPQTEIYRLDTTDLDAAEWSVDITGLTGSTEYDFEFVYTTTGARFYTTSACTTPAQGTPSPSPPRSSLTAAASTTTTTTTTAPAPSPARPLSPVTTLLHSLHLATTTLSETKSALKTLRKQHKTTLSDLRRDIDRTRTPAAPDRAEERAFRRNLALRENIKRAEEENDEMAARLAALQDEPEKLKPIWNEARAGWGKEKARLKSTQSAAAAAKAAADRAAASVESEVAALVAKKEKLAARISKLLSDLERLQSENTAVLADTRKRSIDRGMMQQHRHALKNEFVEAIRALEGRIEEYNGRACENWGTYYALESQGSAESLGFVGSGPPPGLGGMGVGDGGMGERERSGSIFSDGSVVTNFSELNWGGGRGGGLDGGFLPAFEERRRE